MRGSLVMASNSGSASQSTSKPVQIIKIVKPPAGQAETFHASFDGTVKIDFTAIANEKITLCHDNKNQSLHVIFADDSQVIIEPFFDSMAVMSNLVFEMTPGQVLNSAEFASQFPITTDQSVLPAGAEGVQSGAEFNDPSVDPLPPNVPLALLPPEELPPIVFHETIPAPLPTEALALPTLPTLPTVPPPAAIETTGSEALVNEAGLPGIGSNAASNSEIFNGSITSSGGTGPYIYTLNSPATGSHGTLVLNADGTYTYTLTSPFDTTPDSATTAAQTEQDKDSFSYTVTDAHGNTATGTILVDIIDDVPTAHADTDATAVGQFTAETGNVITAVGTTSPVSGVDVLGADGAAVSGVAAGNTNADLDNAATLNTPIQGAFGKLTLAADGSYSYTRDAGTAGGADDVFTYTLKDGDGDLSHTTLTISVGDSTPSDVIPAPGGATTTVFEQGLPARGAEPAGSGEIADGNPTNNSDPSETVSGTIAFTSPDGVSVISLGGLVLTGAPQTLADGTTGTLTASFSYDATTDAGVISYSYTLIDNTLVDPSSSSSFAVVVTDADGDSAPAGNLVISIIDDVPTAHVDSGNVAEGALLTVAAASGVLVNDVAGADGFAAGGGVVGVRAAGSDLTSDVTTGVATPIAGLHGTLHLNADGSYTYQSTANNIAADATDVFVYTIKDGDGDLSTTTLTIDLTNVTLSATDTDALVNEAGLPVIGSNAASNSEIFNGSITPSGGTGPYTFALTSPATGSHGTLVLDAATGTYTYTLTTPFDTTPDSTTTAAQTEQDKDSFGYTVTDAQGNSTTGTILVDIIDDVPTAHVDSGNVAEGALLTVAAASGVLVNDVAGADGFAAGGGVVGVRAAGSDLTSDVTTGVATPIAGLHGTLHLNADGSYTYQSTANNIAADATDVFVYTIKDGDGDLSTTTLTIDLTNVTLSATDTDALVNEAGLPVIGSNAASNSEIFNGSITPSGGTGPYTFALTSPATGSHGTLVLDAATGTYTYTLTTPFDTTPDSTTTAAQTEQDKDSFGYTVTDAQGNSTTGTILVDIIDDVPTAHVDSGNVAEGALLTVAAASGVLVNDVAGADGFAAGGGVVGVRAAGSDLTSDVTTGVATPIAGLHGTLHLNADGSYTYQSTANNIAADATDVFVYTIKDGDGDLSTTTLTIDLTNVTLSATDTDALVNEAGLPVIGSNAASNSEIFNGSITPSGGTGPYTFALTSPATGSHGTLVLDAATGTYTYTLTTPFDTTPDSTTTAAQTEQDKDSFGYTVTDAQGNSTTGTILVDIIDDVPTAHVDSGNVAEGALLTVAAASGVLVNDVAGADGFAAGGGVVGVRAAGSDLTSDVTTGVATPIAGLHGTLHLNADGSYTYQSTANNIAADATDVFVYTIKDGDGDLSTTTLTIDLTNVTLSATDTDALVNEAGLPVIGSNAASNSEIFNGSITPSGGTGPYTFALTSPATGSHGTLVLDAATGTYTYTLTTPFDTTPDSTTTAAQTEQDKDSFGYTVTDAQGNSTTGTILVDIIDDVPTAHVDSGNVAEGALLTVAAASGVLVNDVAGADGFAAGGGVVGVRAAGSDLTSDVTTGVATPIAGLHGTLHLNADGSYTYQSTANNIAADATDVFVYTIKDGDGDLSTTTLTIDLTNVTLSATDTDALVNEAGLPVIGSNAASNSEIFNGSITPSGGTGPYTFALTSPATGSHGTLVLDAATGTYTYTLTTPFDTTPDSTTTAAQTEQDKDSFGYTVTDAQGNSTTGTILVDIIDDVPTAHVDSGNVAEGALLTVAAASGVLVNDVAGADGFAAGGGVVGVRAAGSDLTSDVTTGVATPIAGLHGTLHLNADGSYTYQSTANNIAADATDVFVYTIKDGDGDLSTTTLTIDLTNVTLSATDTDALVNEAGLPVIGSNAASNSEIFNGSITPSGGTGPYTFALTSPATGSHGTLVLDAATGTYTYTLTTPFDTTPDSTTTAAQTEQDKDSFGYTVTDAQGNSTTGTILVDIIDDVPTAHVDSGNVAEGALLTVAAASGVLVNDVAGADGFAAGGGVVGVRAAGSDLTSDVTTGVATPIAGLHGTLHLNADGSYTYQSTANNIAADATDVFVYTIKDGDGDLSTTTLTIDLTNVTLSATDTDALVNEAGLPVIGSNAASNSEIFNGSITPSGGTGPYTFALTSPATGSHGTLVLDAATGTYTYTLTTPFDTTPDSTTTAAQTEQDKDSFGYTVTDAQGNSTTGTILVDIIDDVPTAHVDSGNVAEGALLTVAAASGVLVNDVAGADGFAAGGGVVGVRAAGSDLTSDVTTGVATPIAGLHGTLHLNADGSYTYQSTANNIAADATDVFVYTIKDGDGDLSTTTLTIDLTNVTLSATDTDALVNEAGLPVIGSNAASNSEIFNGSITPSGGTGPYTFALTSPATGSHGTLVLDAATGTYTYTLTTPFDTTPDSTTTAAQTEQDKDSFGYTVTDAQGNSTTGTILVDIIDDVPTAHVDSGNVAEGALLTVAAASGVLVNDVAGADGFAAGGGVVGVRAAGSDLTSDVTTGVATPIAGLHGTLHLNADGSYTYQSTANNIAADATDVFVYTIKDGDGDLSTTTLTIDLTNVTLSATDTDALVNEAGLPVIGSNAASNSEIFNGSITPSGGTGPYTFALTSPATGSHGTLVLDAATGTYTYTLTTPFDTTPDSTTTAAQTEQDKDSFGYTVTDAQGNSTTGTILVDIIDDVPTAHVDSGNVAEGALLTVAAASGVLVNDVAGADGFAAGGGVVGVRAAGSDLTSDVTTGVATPIAGLHGTLHLNADGSYTYQSTANNIAADATDVFVYTIKDGDGDLSTTTLTIDLTNVTLSATDTDALVNEAGLPVIGSNAASNSEIFNGSITPSGGTGPYTFALTSPATGSHGTLVLDAATGTYTYTLTTPFDTTPDSTTTAAQTEQDKDSFGYTVTDAQGNSTTGTILVDIIDDVPTAHVDSGNVAEGALLTVAAASGVLVNDVAGADGFAAGGGVVGVRAAGSDLTSDVTTGVATPIAGLHGTLHLNADGSYTYQSTANNIAADATDVFVYTIKDGDGDLSTTTLTINLANATVLAPTDNDVTVNENALDTTITGSDLAAGTITGSLGTASPAETDASNQLNGSGGFGTLTYALVSGGNAATAGLFGTIQVNADGSYVYTLTKPVTEPTANNGADTVNAAESFTYRVTDADGNTATGTININIVDDVPTAPTVTASAATAGVDETPGVQTTGGASDVLGSSTVTFNGVATSVASLFASVATRALIPMLRLMCWTMAL